MPLFNVKDELQKHNATFVAEEPYVWANELILTGRNPEDAAAFAHALVEKLNTNAPK
jgi:putative intracellular protease/amidase